MRITVVVDDELMARAQEYTGVESKPEIMRMALKALVEREAARRLAKLGGTQRGLEPVPRRRPEPV